GNQVSTAGSPVTVWQNGQRTDNVRPTTTIGRNTFGDITDQQDPTGALTTNQVDPDGRITAQTLPTYTPPGGASITAVAHAHYNPDGRLTDETDPLGRATHYD